KDLTTNLGYVYLKKPDITILGESFEIKPFVGKIKNGLARLLPRALKLPLNHHEWQIVFACEKCDYYLHCSEDSKQEQSLSEIPFLTKTTKLLLNSLDVFNLEQAENCFKNNPDIGKESVAISREREQLIERIRLRKQFLDDSNVKEVVHLRKACPTMPNPIYVEYPIFISSEKENLFGFTYQISMMYRDRGKYGLLPISEEKEQVSLLTEKENEIRYYNIWIMEKSTDEHQILVLKDFLNTLLRLLKEIGNLADTIEPHNRTTHFFTMDKVDLKNVYGSALKYSMQDPELAKLVEQLLSVFPPTEEYIKENEDPGIIWNVPYTVISDVLKRNVILPVRLTLWKMQEVWNDSETNQGVIKVAYPPKKYLRDRSNQFTITFAYDYWNLKESISSNQLQRITQYKIRSLYHIYWYLNKLNQKTKPRIFTLFKVPIKPPRKNIPASNNLRGLATNLLQHLPEDDFIRPLNFFRAIEDLNEYLSYIDGISADLEERRILGLALTELKLVGVELPPQRQRGFVAIFRTSGLNNSKLKLGDVNEYILTDKINANNIFGINPSDRYDYQVKVLNVTRLSKGNLEIRIKLNGPKKGIAKHPLFETLIIEENDTPVDPSLSKKEWVIDNVLINRTGVLIKNFLISFAFQRLGGVFPQYLMKFLPDSTNSSLQEYPIKASHEGMKLWSSNPELKKLSNFNSSQTNAVNSALQNTLSFVWGPPGTGKTRVIAWSIIINLWYNILTNDTGYKVAVIAFTNRAIDNALEKIIENMKSYIDHEPKLTPLKPFHLFRAIRKKKIEHYYFDGSNFKTKPEILENDKGVVIYYDLVFNPKSNIIVCGTIFQLHHLLNREDYLVKTHEELDLGRWDNYVRPTKVFDFITVDEASQMKVTDFFVAAYGIKENGRFLVVGDDKQLPPVVVGEYPEDYKNKVSSVYNYLKNLTEDLTPIMLNTTYRFSDYIADFPSKTYYESQLKSNVAKEYVKFSESILNSNYYTILDPVKQILLITYDGPLRAQDNEFEAEIVAELTKELSNHLITDTGEKIADNKFSNEILGIITPHNAQINAIKNQLSIKGIPNNRFPLVDTVDKYQGQEREIIIISYGVSDPDYAEREAEFILSPNRFNVSITRPKKKYIIIISENLLEMLPEEEKLLQPALELQAYREEFDNVEEFVFELEETSLKCNIYY
ncbi:MAG: DEAD/DEAH box helicase, partial [Candidatus Hodarchaeales archaeon]